MMQNISAPTLSNLQIDNGLYRQIVQDAKSANQSLQEYVEALLYRCGYRPYNAETVAACEETRKGKFAGTVDTSSFENFVASILGDEEN